MTFPVAALPRVFLGALVAAMCLPITAYADVEMTIVDHVDANNARALELLERVVNINSGTMNFAGVRETGGVFQREFDALGCETQWIDGKEFNRAGHLVARCKGRGKGRGPGILLIGHLDTVFEPDSPFQRYEPVGEHHARGPGITDMKGGNIVILFALSALKAAGVLDDMDLTVVMIGDEEKSGKPLAKSRKALLDAAHDAEIAIGFEDGDGDPETVVIARRGSSGWNLAVTGKPAHSSQIFRDDVGYGAIFEAARILNGFREALAGEANLTFNPGVIVGGTDVAFDSSQARGTAFGKNNVIAEHVVVSGDLRTLSPQQLTRARERMAKIAQDSLPNTSAKLTFRDGYPPLPPSAGNRRLLALYDQVSRDLGFGAVTAVNPERAGAADVSFTSGLVDMAIDGIGLMGEGGHTVKETADLRTLPMQTKRAAVLLYRLIGK